VADAPNQTHLFAPQGDLLEELEAKSGVYTAERYLALHPERVGVVLRLYSQTVPYREIDQLHRKMFGQGIHRLTVRALVEHCAPQLEEIRKDLAAKSLLGTRELMSVVMEGVAALSGEAMATLTPKDVKELATAMEKMATVAAVLNPGGTAAPAAPAKTEEAVKAVELADGIEEMYR
jgi:hypothetical protein